MARSINDIYLQMVGEKNTQPNLSALQPNIDDEQTLLTDLSSTSKVAIWRLFFYVIAVAIHITEVVLEAIMASEKPGVLYWYYEQALKYQHGDSLILDNGKYVYNPVVEANRIITLAAVDEIINVNNNRLVKIKVAKAGPVPLTPTEKIAFTSYINTVKFAGVATEVITDVADVLKFGANIFYDPLVFASDGSLLSNPSVFPVKDAIDNYIKTLPFNGVLELQKLIDVIQKVPGVKNVVPLEFKAKYGLQPYDDVMLQPGQSYKPNAGYLKISVAVGETLADTLNYIVYA